MIGSENEIARDDHAQRPARAHFQRRLNAKIAIDDALSRLVRSILKAVAHGVCDAVIIINGEFAPDTENRRQPRGNEESAPKIIHLV